MLRASSKVVMLLLTALLCATSGCDVAVGAVYAMTNASSGNEIVVYERAHDGTLTFARSVSTGGLGSGGAAPLEPVDALGSQSPLLLSQDARWLVAVNAGSNELSVFRVRDSHLELTDKVDSGGLFPASVTLQGGRLYVLNSGGDGNITGFHLQEDGHLMPIPGSTRSLGAGGTQPPFFLVSPAQVGFDPSGGFLVVTIKGTNRLLVFQVGSEDVPSDTPVVTEASGSTPFGLTFTAQGHLLVAEAFGQATVGTPNAGAVSSYDLRSDGPLQRVSVSVANLQTATCWIATTPNGRFAYTANNGSNTISGYQVQSSGELALIDESGAVGSTEQNPVDLAITRDGRFVYAVNAGSGTVSMYRINLESGQLTGLGAVGGLPVRDGAVGIAAQ